MRKARPFFSALQKTLEEKMPERASILQIRNILNKGGVKADEIKWSGLDDFLANQTGDTVSRPKLLDYLKTNEVQIEETLKGPIGEGDVSWLDQMDAKIRAGQKLSEDELQRYDDLVSIEEGYGNQPKFDPYQLPGGKNYRELLLTTPGVSKPMTFPEWLAKEYPGSDLTETSPGFQASMRQRYRSLVDSNSPKVMRGDLGDYESPHWDEPNVLAHARLNERTAPDGKKTLVIEEIQSDWHQEGRQKGYGPEGRKFIAKPREDGDWDIYTPPETRGQEVGRFFDTVKGATPEEALANWRKQVTGKGQEYLLKGLPEGPFAKNWHELTFRRVVQWAAENGFDQIAWTTGDQQSERYSLANHLRSLTYEKRGPDEVWLHGTGHGGNQVPIGVVKRNALADHVGQDVAARILADPEPHGILSGEGLKVGGEGMRGFYDKMLPDYAAKFGKKWGATPTMGEISNAPDLKGAKPGDIRYRNDRPSHWVAVDKNDPTETPLAEFTNLDDVKAWQASIHQPPGQQVHLLPITDAMRQSVTGEGQPLFNAVPGLEGAALSQAGTEEDTTPQERLGRAGAGLGAGLFGGRFARGGWRAGARAGARAAETPPPTQAIADAREAFRIANAEMAKAGKKGLPQQELADLAEAVTRYAAQQDPKGDSARLLKNLDRHPEIMANPADRARTLLGAMYKKGHEEDFAQFMNEVPMDDPVAIANAVKTLGHKNLRTYADWVWFNGLLSSPLGRIADTVGSTLANVGFPLERAAAVPFDVAMGAFTGKRTIRAGEIPAEYAGMAAAQKEGLQSALETLSHGFSAQEARSDLGAAGREPIQGPFNGALLNSPSRLIRANDAYQGAMASRAALYADSFRMAKQEGLKGQDFADRVAELRANPTDEMVAHAKAVKNERTWQQQTGVGQGISYLKGKVPGSEVFLPFHNTPLNLAKYAFDRSPFGLATVLGKAAKRDQQGVAEGLARVSLGSALMYGMYQLAEQGLISGPSPSDATTRDEWARTGKQPFSVKIGDTWYSYAKLPFAPVMAVGPAVADAMQNAKADDPTAAFTAGTLAMAKGMADVPFMQSLGDTLAAVQDPEKKGGAYIEGLARGVIPQWLQTASRATDQELRNPDGPWEAILSVLPGANQLVPGRETAFGEPNLRPEGQQGLGAINPLKPSQAKSNRVERELARLNLPSEGYRVQPGMVGRDLTIDKETVKLTPEEQLAYQKAAGQLAFGQLYNAMGTDQWKQSSDEEQRKYIHNVYAKAHEQARKTVIPLLQERAKAQQQRRQERLAPTG